MTSYLRILSCYALGWIPMVFIAIGNGGIRESIYSKYMGELSAHQLSSVSAILLFTIYTFFLHNKFPLSSKKEALAVGFLWLSMTIGFEFIFGHYIIGNSWEILFSDYNIFHGRLWILVFASVMLLPLAIFRKNHNQKI